MTPGPGWQIITPRPVWPTQRPVPNPGWQTQRPVWPTQRPVWPTQRPAPNPVWPTQRPGPLPTHRPPLGPFDNHGPGCDCNGPWSTVRPATATSFPPLPSPASDVEVVVTTLRPSTLPPNEAEEALASNQDESEVTTTAAPLDEEEETTTVVPDPENLEQEEGSGWMPTNGEMGDREPKTITDPEERARIMDELIEMARSLARKRARAKARRRMRMKMMKEREELAGNGINMVRQFDDKEPDIENATARVKEDGTIWHVNPFRSKHDPHERHKDKEATTIRFPVDDFLENTLGLSTESPESVPADVLPDFEKPATPQLPRTSKSRFKDGFERGLNALATLATLTDADIKEEDESINGAKVRGFKTTTAQFVNATKDDDKVQTIIVRPVDNNAIQQRLVIKEEVDTTSPPPTATAVWMWQSKMEPEKTSNVSTTVKPIVFPVPNFEVDYLPDELETQPEPKAEPDLPTSKQPLSTTAKPSKNLTYLNDRSPVTDRDFTLLTDSWFDQGPNALTTTLKPKTESRIIMIKPVDSNPATPAPPFRSMRVITNTKDTKPKQDTSPSQVFETMTRPMYDDYYYYDDDDDAMMGEFVTVKHAHMASKTPTVRPNNFKTLPRPSQSMAKQLPRRPNNFSPATHVSPMMAKQLPPRDAFSTESSTTLGDDYYDTNAMEYEDYYSDDEEALPHAWNLMRPDLADSWQPLTSTRFTMRPEMASSNSHMTTDHITGSVGHFSSPRQPKMLNRVDDKDLLVYYPLSGQPFLSFPPSKEFSSIVRSA